MMKRVLVIALLFTGCALAQNIPLSNLNATADDALYTTYAAQMSRSEYFVDEGYHLNYYTPERGVSYTTDYSGDFALGWRLNKLTAIASRDFYKQPVIHRSYTDMAGVEYWPFTTIQVRETLVVYSSRLAFVNVEITNHSGESQQLQMYAYYQNSQPVTDLEFKENQYAIFQHVQDPKTYFETPQPKYNENRRDLFMLSVPADTWGGYRENDLIPEITNRDFLNGLTYGQVRGIVLSKRWTLAPGETKSVRVIRGVQQATDDASALIEAGKKLITEPLEPLIAQSEAQYKAIPKLALPNKDWELAYWSAFSLVRQQMMPPEGESKHNYYVFSREPTWSWGHEGQVFHESLSMLSYAYMDAASAEESQRVYFDRQRPDGYIAYRIGPYVTKTFPYNGEDTTSAPFFAWQNSEIYQVSRDRKFLEEAYRSSSAFARYVLRTRDKDHDGFLVWGGNSMLENVRDELDVIWQLFGDKTDSPSRVKALDLMCMMVKEQRSLAAMARELGKQEEAKQWDAGADKLSDLVRTKMWDEQSGNFFSLSRDTGTMVTGDGISLKRPEIVTFLPMWAGIATKEQAARLVKNLTNSKTFWRRFGVPTLSAADSYYDPQITKCCQWNGAVWLLWDYMVFRGLLDYGYHTEAEEIVKRNMDAVMFQLKRNHRFWESFSPDYTQLNSPKNYLWDSIIARMMIDLYGPGTRAASSESH
ncbi:MAG TPA: trehalase family glycosidase [Terriglobales bacterium]|nr:trehalase family glycosidase [Terriglobales bacterium]